MNLSTSFREALSQLHNTNISGNIVNNNDDFNEPTNTLLYKNIPLTLYSWTGWCWLCVRGELETGTDCYILTQRSSRDHSSTSSSSWLGCSTVGHWGPKPSVWSWFSLRWHPVSNRNSNWLKPSVAPGYIIVSRPPASCGRTHLPPSPNSTTSTGQGDIPRSSTGCTCFAVLPLIYTGASLDWRLSRGSICYNFTMCQFEQSLVNFFKFIYITQIILMLFLFNSHLGKKNWNYTLCANVVFFFFFFLNMPFYLFYLMLCYYVIDTFSFFSF